MTKRILLIDDEPDIVRLTQITLTTMRGWHVRVAASGEEGIQMACDQQPDAILLDLMMPEMDGQEVCRILRQTEQTQAIPIILLTAKIRNNTASAYTCLGVSGVITKPFNAVQLSAEISEILRWE
jgi:CheY-like chemotaxis protein